MNGAVTETFVYDYNGRIIRKSATAKDYDGGTVHYTSYAYDLSGNLRQVVYEDEAKQTPFCVTYRINCLGQVASVSEGDGELAVYSYNADSSIREETYWSDAGAVLIRCYRYDARGRLTEISDPYFVESVTYTENGFNGYISYTGRIVSAGCRFGGFQDGKPEDFVTEYRYQYAYDRLGRLTTAQHDRDPKWSYGVTRPVFYDANGNARELYRQEKPAEFDYKSGTNKLVQTGIQTNAYRYDAAGNVTGAPARAISKIAYDLQSQQAVLMEVNDGQDALTFCYDGGGRRVYKKGSNDQKLYVLSPKGLPLLEKIELKDETAYYIYGPTGLLAVKKQGEIYYLIKDHSGSTRALCDDAGICAAYSYDPFGNFLGEVFESQGQVTDHLYTGQELDRESGLYNYKARFYDTYLGRLYSTDPAGQFASPYIYAGGDPVNFIDPSGLWTWSTGNIFTTVAGIVSIAAGGIALATGIGAGPAIALFSAGASSIMSGAGNMMADREFNFIEWGVSVGLAALPSGWLAQALPLEKLTEQATKQVLMLALITEGVIANGLINVANDQNFFEGSQYQVIGGLGAGLMMKMALQSRYMKLIGELDELLLEKADIATQKGQQINAEIISSMKQNKMQLVENLTVKRDLINMNYQQEVTDFRNTLPSKYKERLLRETRFSSQFKQQVNTILLRKETVSH